jgi:hypothetical protein
VSLFTIIFENYLIRIFLNRISRFIETEIYDHWMAMSGRMKTKSTNETIIHVESSGIQPLSLTKTAGIFYLMICEILA